MSSDDGDNNTNFLIVPWVPFLNHEWETHWKNSKGGNKTVFFFIEKYQNVWTIC